MGLNNVLLTPEFLHQRESPEKVVKNTFPAAQLLLHCTKSNGLHQDSKVQV